MSFGYDFKNKDGITVLSSSRPVYQFVGKYTADELHLHSSGFQGSTLLPPNPSMRVSGAKVTLPPNFSSNPEDWLVFFRYKPQDTEFASGHVYSATTCRAVVRRPENTDPIFTPVTAPVEASLTSYYGDIFCPTGGTKTGGLVTPNPSMWHATPPMLVGDIIYTGIKNNYYGPSEPYLPIGGLDMCVGSYNSTTGVPNYATFNVGNSGLLTAISQCTGTSTTVNTANYVGYQWANPQYTYAKIDGRTATTSWNYFYPPTLWTNRTALTTERMWATAYLNLATSLTLSDYEFYLFCRMGSGSGWDSSASGFGAVSWDTAGNKTFDTRFKPLNLSAVVADAEVANLTTGVAVGDYNRYAGGTTATGTLTVQGTIPSNYASGGRSSLGWWQTGAYGNPEAADRTIYSRQTGSAGTGKATYIRQLIYPCVIPGTSQVAPRPVGLLTQSVGRSFSTADYLFRDFANQYYYTGGRSGGATFFIDTSKYQTT